MKWLPNYLGIRVYERGTIVLIRKPAKHHHSKIFGLCLTNRKSASIYFFVNPARILPWRSRGRTYECKRKFIRSRFTRGPFPDQISWDPPSLYGLWNGLRVLDLKLSIMQCKHAFRLSNEFFLQKYWIPNFVPVVYICYLPVARSGWENR
jgi:hypothetical protein